jgi:signal transduction histidine kinase
MVEEEDAASAPGNRQTVSEGDIDRLRNLLELVSDDIWECDRQLCLTKVQGRNQGSRATLALLVGGRLEGMADPEAPAEDLPRLTAALAARQPFGNCTCAIRLPDGRQEWLRLSGFPLVDREGGFEGYLGTSTRITEERHRLATERRRQQLESLGQLAGGVAHEFNNLLVPITMLAKLGLQRVGEDETLRTYLNTIHDSGWKAAEIVRSVLTYARQMTPSAQPIACGAVVAERMRLLRQALPPAVVIEAEISDQESRVLGNANELAQVVVNLVSNASDALGERGTIRCQVDRIRLSAAECRGWGLATAEVMRIVIADTGCGIDPELQDRIFEPFFTTKPIGQGTGLGLSVVEGIVKDWGGHITLESSRGTGTRFTILLPIVEAAA